MDLISVNGDVFGNSSTPVLHCFECTSRSCPYSTFYKSKPCPKSYHDACLKNDKLIYRLGQPVITVTQRRCESSKRLRRIKKRLNKDFQIGECTEYEIGSYINDDVYAERICLCKENNCNAAFSWLSSQSTRVLTFNALLLILFGIWNSDSV